MRSCFDDGCTIKRVYKDHPRDPECVAVVNRWLLFEGKFMIL